MAQPGADGDKKAEQIAYTLIQTEEPERKLGDFWNNDKLSDFALGNPSTKAKIR